MNVSFDGYNEGILTFEADSSVTVGVPVEISANGKVKAAQNKAFCGICVGVRDGYAAVQMDGYVKAKYSGTVTLGYLKLAGADGNITADAANGRELLVVDIDSISGYAGIIL